MSTLVAGEHIADTYEIRRVVQRETLIAFWRVAIAAAAGTVAAFARQRRMKRAIADLSVLSDRMLNDIGIERHGIESAVRYGRGAGQLSR